MSLFRILLRAVLVAAAFFPPLALAQQWPAKPVRIISVFPPGGSVDQVARVFANELQQQTGQLFIVENRGGASGSIGTQAVASAAPDGYTFGVVFDTHAVNPLLIPGLPYDTLKDLAPVMLVGTSPMAIVANAKQPYKDFAEVIAAARAKPGTISIGSIGTGSLGHLAVAQIARSEKIDITHVPYRGGGPLMIDVVGGQVPLAIGSVFLVNPHVKGGKLRAPAKTPQPVIERMYEELSKALKKPAVAQRLSEQGIEIVGGGPEELDRFVRGEMARWAVVVKENGIKAGD